MFRHIRICSMYAYVVKAEDNHAEDNMLYFYFNRWAFTTKANSHVRFTEVS